MNFPIPSFLCLALSLTLASAPAVAAREIYGEAPADFSRASTFDVVTADGSVHLLFGQPDANGELAFFYTRSDDDGHKWSAPVPVHTSHAPPGRHPRGHDPQLAISGERLLSLWTAQGDGPWGSGPLAASLSVDGGRTWQAAPAPGEETDREDVGYRFPAVAGDNEGFHAIWIHAVDAERSLRHARLDFGQQSWTSPVIIDPQICACCWNQLKVGADGSLYAVYRNQDPSDMSLAISHDRGANWRDAGAVGAFDWFFQGCPHVGAGLALGFNGSESPFLLASVWTGHAEKGGAYILRSGNDAQSWRQAPLPGPKTWGHVNTDIALLPAGDRAALVWDAPQAEGRRAVFAATSGDSGESWTEPVLLSADADFATHPKIVTGQRRGFLVFWTGKDSDGESQLLMTRVE